MPDADTTVAKDGQNAPGSDKPDHAQHITKEELNAAVNSAVTSQLKRTLAKELGSAIEGALAPFKAELEKIGLARIAADAESKTEPKQTQDDASKAAAQGKQKSDEPDTKYVALEAKLAKLEADNKRDKEALTRERRSAVEARVHGELRSQLTGKVRPEAVGVVADLIRARNQLVIDSDGNARIKVRARLEAGLPEEDHELSLEDGLPHFLKSKEAALFMPPPPVAKAGKTRLSGDTPGARAANGDAASSNGALNAVAERLNANINDLL